MRITVVSAGDVTRDPAAPPLLHSLDAAGHEVTLVAARPGTVGNHEALAPPPAGRSNVLRSTDPTRAVGKVVNRTRPDVIHPVRKRDLDAALASKRGLIARGVAWEVPPARDLIAQAPHRPEASRSMVADNLGLFHPDDRRPPTDPRPGRHRGRRIAIVHRHTATSPGRYLTAAAQRSGADVQSFDGAIDWTQVAADTEVVVFVESPYPAMPITGHNPGIPVLFWVHHGEHHLHANLRLTDRYGVDAVLLAHSWHLAHRFPVAVHRFPFAVAPELYADEPMPWADRTIDVAMVGAGLDEESPRYRTRRLRVDDLKREFGARAVFRSDVAPEAMAALYSTAHVVINDGGARHFPITMRVFEAIGAGALLATDPIPGTDLLFDKGHHYEELAWTIAAHVSRLVAEPGSGDRACAAYHHARRHHTYDHRIDELFMIAAATTHRDRTARTSPSGLDAIIADDVEVSSIAVFGDAEVRLPDREVRSGDRLLEGDATGRVDAAVLAGVGDLVQIAGVVRRYLYLVRPEPALLDAAHRRLPEASLTSHDDIVRIDLGAPGYVSRTEALP